MAIDRIKGQLTLSCDNCGEFVEGDDFNEMWEAAKAAGWKARKIGEEWFHRCPDPSCQASPMAAQYQGSRR